MKKNDNIRVEMVRVAGNVAPLVEIDYMDKEAKEHTGFLLLDSCSTHNILFNEMQERLGVLCIKGNESTCLDTTGNCKVTVKDVRFSFVMSGQQFHEDFCLSERETPYFVDDVPVIGLLGNMFFQQQNLVIDYDDFSLHTSEVTHENLAIPDCDFFFPMEIGLKNYGIPIVSLFQNEKEIPMMADSGASGNMIAKQTIADCCMDHKLLDETDTISGIGGSVDTRLAIASFSLLTLKGNDMEEISRKAKFHVLPNYVYIPKDEECDENGEQLPPIEGTISCSFMAREKWILDFGAKIIYKRKKKDRLKEAV